MTEVVRAVTQAPERTATAFDDHDDSANEHQ